jgi:hypothetical protein
MSNFDQRIAAKEGELNSAVAQLEAIRKQFLPIVAQVAVEWWTATARREVETDPTTEKLSDEQISSLKADVQLLCSDAALHVEEFFSGSKTWWHLQNPLVAHTHGLEYFYHVMGNRGPDQLDKPLRGVLGKLGPLLEKYGYLQRDASLRRTYGNAWRDPSSSKPHYPFSLDWPKPLTPLVDRYQTQLKAAQELVTDIASIRREQKEAAAGKRWDSA